MLQDLNTGKAALSLRIKSCNYQINIKEISAKDLLLFQEKRLEPGTLGATNRSIGFIGAVEWFFPHAYDLTDETGRVESLSAARMDEYGFEMPHILKLVSQIGRVVGEVEIHDGAPDYDESDDFSFEGQRIKRMPISWRHTPAFLRSQRSNDLTKINIEMIQNYFTINDQPIANEMLINPGAIDLRLISLIVNRLGKLLNLD